MKRTIALIFSLAFAANAATAAAESGLKNEQDINEGLLIMAVADKIRRACDEIGGRLFRARAFADTLEEVAMDRGYSADEIDAYINNDTEKAKVRERRNAYFQSKGASNLDPQSLCMLGRDEIARNTQIGHLLRAK